MQASIDGYGNVYVGGGPNVGKSRLPFTASLVAGYLPGQRIPAEQELLTGEVISVGGGVVIGGNIVYSPGNGVGFEEGFFTPQFGVQWSEAVHYATVPFKLPQLSAACRR